jgi:hypothetical protein
MTRLPYSALVALRVIFDANLSSALISTRTGCKFVIRNENRSSHIHSQVFSIYKPRRLPTNIFAGISTLVALFTKG